MGSHLRTSAVIANTKKKITNISVAAVLAVTSLSGAAPLFFTQKAFADTVANVYVRPDGNDTNCDGTQNSANVGTPGTACAKQTIEAAIAAASTGNTILVTAGTYAANNILVDKSVSIIGAPGAVVTVPNVTETNAFKVQANNVTISGLTITGPANGVSYKSYAWGGTITRGIFVYNGYTNFAITNNVIKGLRNNILIDGRNTGTITSNVIDNSKSGISVQYTDAGTGNTEGYNVVISGNSEGTYGNEWGVNAHLNGHIIDSSDPTNLAPNGTKIASVAPATVQTALLHNSDLNGGWTVQDQGYAYQNRTIVYVGGTNASDVNQGSPLGQLATLQKAVDAVVNSGTVVAAAGTYNSFSVVGRTDVTIAGAGAGLTVVNPTTLVNTGVGHKYTANMQVSVFVSNSTDITLSGVTVKDGGLATNPDALVFWNASTGTFEDSVVDADYTITGAQTGQGIAVDGGTTDLAINNVTISGFQKNGIDIVDGNSGAVPGNIQVSVTGGSITGAGSITTIAQNGIVAWNRGGGNVYLSVYGTTVKDFVYSGSQNTAAAGINIYGSASVDLIEHVTFSNSDYFVSNATSSPVVADNNWWGQALGVNSDYLDGDVVVDSWCSVADCSATLVKDSSNTTVLPDNTPVDLSGSLIGNTATVPNTNDVVVVGSGSVEVLILAGTQVTAVGSGVWDGIISAPQVSTANVPGVPGNTITITSAIKVGSDTFSLQFDQPVRLVFPGQTGANVHVGFQAADGVFHEITTVCDTNLTPAAQLVGSTHECKYDTGTDMLVWTDHFTTFATYTRVATPSATSTSSSSNKTATTSARTVASTTSDNATDTVASVLGAASGIAGDSTKTPATTQSPEKATDDSSAFLGLGWWWLAVGAALLLAAGYGGNRYLNSTSKR